MRSLLGGRGPRYDMKPGRRAPRGPSLTQAAAAASHVAMSKLGIELGGLSWAKTIPMALQEPELEKRFKVLMMTAASSMASRNAVD